MTSEDPYTMRLTPGKARRKDPQERPQGRPREFPIHCRRLLFPHHHIASVDGNPQMVRVNFSTVIPVIPKCKPARVLRAWGRVVKIPSRLKYLCPSILEDSKARTSSKTDCLGTALRLLMLCATASPSWLERKLKTRLSHCEGLRALMA